MEEYKHNLDCEYCAGTEAMSWHGICAVYVKPFRWLIVMVLLSLGAAFFYSSYCVMIMLILLSMPMANADLRLYLFLPVAVGKMLGRRVNCPKCNPGGPIFLD